MPCNFKAVILWSLMHNFWVCGVSSAGKDAFLSPDHIFLLGILITSFNSFYTFFLAGLPCSWGASPISGGLEGQPEVVTVARIPEVAEAGLPCLVLFGHILQPCWTAKPLQGLAAHCPRGEGPRSSPGAGAPLVPAQLQPGCEQLGLEDYLPPAKLAVGVWSSLRTHEEQGLFPPGACLHGWWLLCAGPQCDPALSRAQKGTVLSQKSCRDTATLLGSSLCFFLPKPHPLGTALSYF